MTGSDREPTTYYALAQVDDADAGARPAVIGASAHGPKLPAPQWCTDAAALVPPEPPLGLRVDEVPDLGFPNQERTDDDAETQHDE